jgi:hypothetical protein
MGRHSVAKSEMPRQVSTLASDWDEKRTRRSLMRLTGAQTEGYRQPSCSEAAEVSTGTGRYMTVKRTTGRRQGEGYGVPDM